MTYLAHLATGIALFFSSLFGGHLGVQTVPQSNASATTTVAASSTTSIAASAPQKPSFLSSIISMGAAMATTIKTPVVTANANTTTTLSNTATPAATTAQASSTAVPAGSNSIDQKQVLQVAPNPSYGTIYSVFKLSGKSSAASIVSVALVPFSFGSTDWATVEANPTTRIASATVSNGIWSTTWNGIADGNYEVLVYDSATSELLTSSSLSVQGVNDLNFAGYPGTPIVLGLGESATDGVVNVKLISVANVSGVPTADLSITAVTGTFVGNQYTATIGQGFPTDTTGFKDATSASGAINIKVSNISATAKTVTLLANYVQETMQQQIQH